VCPTCTSGLHGTITLMAPAWYVSGAPGVLGGLLLCILTELAIAPRRAVKRVKRVVVTGFECGVALGLSLILVLAMEEAYSRVTDMIVTPLPSIASTLTSMPRINASDSKALWRHVTRRTPAILVLSPSAKKSLPAWNETAFLDLCGSTQVSLVSEPIRLGLKSYRDHVSGTNVHRLIFLALEQFAFGWGGLEGFLDTRRRISMRDFTHKMRSSNPFSGIFHGMMTRFAPRRLAPLVDALNMLGSTMYLGDEAIFKDCPALHSIEPANSTALTAAQKLLNAQVAAVTKIAKRRHNVAIAEHAPSPPAPVSFFWGPDGSQLYPLHKDNADSDTLTLVLHGSKKAVVVRPFDGIKSYQIHGTKAYGLDVFEDRRGRDVGKVDGWVGEVRAGEMLFLPTTALHAVKNQGNGAADASESSSSSSSSSSSRKKRRRDTVSLTTRPWMASDMDALSWLLENDARSSY
jgi:hypothetical protein